MLLTSFSSVSPDDRDEIREYVEHNPDILEHILGECGCVYFKFRPEDDYEYLVIHLSTDDDRKESVNDDWSTDTNFGYWWRYNPDPSEDILEDGWDCGMAALNQSIREGLPFDEQLTKYVLFLKARQEKAKEDTIRFEMLPLADLIALTEVIQANLALMLQAQKDSLSPDSPALSMEEMTRIARLLFLNLALLPAREALARALGSNPFEQGTDSPKVMGQIKASVLESLGTGASSGSDSTEDLQEPKLTAYETFFQTLFPDSPSEDSEDVSQTSDTSPLNDAENDAPEE